MNALKENIAAFRANLLEITRRLKEASDPKITSDRRIAMLRDIEPLWTLHDELYASLDAAGEVSAK